MKSLEEIIKPYKKLLENIDYKKVNNGNLKLEDILFSED